MPISYRIPELKRKYQIKQYKTKQKKSPAIPNSDAATCWGATRQMAGRKECFGTGGELERGKHLAELVAWGTEEAGRLGNRGFLNDPRGGRGPDAGGQKCCWLGKPGLVIQPLLTNRISKSPVQMGFNGGGIGGSGEEGCRQLLSWTEGLNLSTIKITSSSVAQLGEKDGGGVRIKRRWLAPATYWVGPSPPPSHLRNECLEQSPACQATRRAGGRALSGPWGCYEGRRWIEGWTAERHP